MNKATMRHTFFIASIIAILHIPLSAHTTHTMLIKPVKLTSTERKTVHNPSYITIWVHGARTMGKISDLVHACPPGLHKAANLGKKHRLRNLIMQLAEVDPGHFPLETFYAFGWSGRLDFNEREQAAKELYASIKQVAREFTSTYHHEPKIQLISHSHGGNVILNLAKIKDSADKIVIERAILLAAPVQEETKMLAHDDLFKHIDVIYSSADRVQVLDPQGWYHNARDKKYPLFSQRHFPAHPNMHQVELKIDGHRLGHLSFVRLPFITKLPAILAAMEQLEINIPGATNSHEECLLCITCAKEQPAVTPLA